MSVSGGWTIRRATMYAGAAALVICAIAALLLVFLLSAPVQQYGKSVLVQRLDVFIEGDVTIGELRTNLINRVDLRNVRISSVRTSDLVTLDHIRVQYELLSLLRRTITVPSITIDGAGVTITRGFDGKFRFPFLPPERRARPEKARDTTAAPWRVVLGTARVAGLNAAYHDSALSIHAVLQGIGARGRLERLDSILTTISARQGWVSTPWWRGGIDSLQAGGEISGRMIRFDDVALWGDSVTISGSGAIPVKNGAFDLVAEVATFTQSLPVIAASAPGISGGRIRATALFRGLLADPVLSVDASAVGALYRGLALDSLRVKGDYSGNDSLTADATIISRAGRVWAQTAFFFPDLLTRPRFRDYRAQAKVDRVRVGRVARALGFGQMLPAVVGQAVVSVEGRGVDSLPRRATIRTRLTGLVPGEEVEVGGQLGETTWSLDGALGEGNRFSGAGTLTQGGEIAGSLEGEVGRPHTLTAAFLEHPVRGKLAFSASVDGTVGKPRFLVDISSDTLAWQGILARRIGARLEYDGETLRIVEGHAEASADLHSVLPAFGIPDVGGRAAVSARVEGALDRPRIRAEASVEDAFYRGYRAEKVSGRFSFAGDTLVWTGLNISESESHLTGTGQYSWASQRQTLRAEIDLRRNGTRSGTVNVGAALTRDSVDATVQIVDVNTAVALPWFPQVASMEGTAGLDLGIAGPLSDPSAAVSFTLDQTDGNGRIPASYEGRFALKDSTVSGTLRAFPGRSANPLVITTRVPVDLGRPWTIEKLVRDGAEIAARGDSIRYGPLLERIVTGASGGGFVHIDAAARKESGVWALSGGAHLSTDTLVYLPQQVRTVGMAADLSLSGSERQPLVSFSVRGDSIRYRRLMVTALRAEGAASPDSVRLDTLGVAFADDGAASVRGTIPLDSLAFLLSRPGTNFAFNLKAVPLTTVSPFVPGVLISGGVISGAGRVRTTGAGLRAAGHLVLADARLGVEDCEPEVGPLDLEVELSGDSVILRSLTGRVGGGKVRGRGFVQIGREGVVDATGRIAAGGIRLECSDFDAGVEEAALEIVRRDRGFAIKGNVDLAQSRYTRDLSLPDLVEQIQGSGIAPPAAEPNPILQQIGLLLTIDLNERLAIESNLGRLVLDGVASFGGNLASPSFTGEIRIAEGYLYYLDRKFTIREGTIRQFDPDRIDPLIDITAETQMLADLGASGTEYRDQADVTITLGLQGQLSGPPRVTLTSDRQLSEPQIVSLLTLGTISGGLGEDITGRLGAILERQLLAGFGARQLERLLGVESIEITGGSVFDIPRRGGPVVTVTKRLSPRLVVSYGTVIGLFEQQQVTLSYRLFPFLYLVGERTDLSSGIDFRFRFSR